MATEVNLPALGETVTEGTVTQWLKSVGDDVAVDEPLLEVSTDKVDTEIPSPVAGQAARDQGRRGRDRRGRRGARGDRRGGRVARVTPTAMLGPVDESADERRASRGVRESTRRTSRREAPARTRLRTRAARASHRPSRRQPPQADAEQSGGRRRLDRRDAARARRERHRGHRHPVAEVGRRRRRRRRAAARGLDRQGRHRDPLPRRRASCSRSRPPRTRPSRSAPCSP